MNEDESMDDEVNEQREEGRKEANEHTNVNELVNGYIMCSNSANVVPTFSSTLQKFVGCALWDVVK